MRSTQGTLVVLVVLVGGVVVLCTPARRAAAKSTGPCTKTADALLKSCRFDAGDEFWHAAGRCENQAIKDDVRACRAEAKAEQQDAKQQCVEQHGARLDVCADLGPGAYRPVIDAQQFGGPINNPYLPMTPGTTRVFESPGEHDEVTVTSETRQILGVTCVVVRDVVTDKQSGEVTEDTLDFFAQDAAGNVWYFGEESKQLEHGALVSIDGSWQAGRDDAQPGIIMKATRAVGDEYRQEYAPGEAEDLARIVSLTESVTVPAGSFSNLVETEEFSPMEPGAVEHKFYASGVGEILTVDENGVRSELVP